MVDIILASHNAHKLEELKRIIEPVLPTVQLQNDDGPEPVENGTSFAENALIKARAAAARTGKIALADDSGISVEVMNGAPGIFSARWAGANKADAANLQLLLEQLADVPAGKRAAAFVCAAAAVLPEPDGEFTELVVVAEWPGALLTAPQGENGFGYDPIFMPEGYSVSAAELDPAEKDAISHRYRAFSQLAPKLAALIDRI